MTVLLSRFVAIADVAGIYRVPQFPLCIASPHLKCCLTSAFHSSLMLAVFMISCKSEYSSRVFIKASKPSRIGISPAAPAVTCLLRRGRDGATTADKWTEEWEQLARCLASILVNVARTSARLCATHPSS